MVKEHFFGKFMIKMINMINIKVNGRKDKDKMAMEPLNEIMEINIKVLIVQ